MRTVTLYPFAKRYAFLAVFFLASLLSCRPKRSLASEDARIFSARFLLLVDSIWNSPKPAESTPVKLGLAIVNLGKDTVRFPLMDKFRISLEDSVGHHLTMDGGRDWLIDKNPYSEAIAPGDSFVHRIECHLDFGAKGQLRLEVKDGYGSIWWIGPLAAGNYQFIMEYENAPLAKTSFRDVWKGRAEIAPVSIQILKY